MVASLIHGAAYAACISQLSSNLLCADALHVGQVRLCS